MTLIAQIRSVVAGLLRRNRIEGSMSDEMRFHIEAYTRDLIRSGVPPDDAVRRARVEFGGIELYKERCREAPGRVASFRLNKFAGSLDGCSPGI
jgi:hypothetical protein